MTRPETGCGKTTVVQLLGMLLERQLHVINCHASTETSDLLGGLRPVRRREDIVKQMISLVKDLIESWPNQDQIEALDIPSFLLYNSSAKAKPYPTDAPSIILGLVDAFVAIDAKQPSPDASVASFGSDLDKKSSKKRRKLESGEHIHVRSTVDVGTAASKAKELYQKYCSLFEWVDGPLVTR